MKPFVIMLQSTYDEKLAERWAEGIREGRTRATCHEPGVHAREANDTLQTALLRNDNIRLQQELTQKNQEIAELRTRIDVLFRQSDVGTDGIHRLETEGDHH